MYKGKGDYCILITVFRIILLLVLMISWWLALGTIEDKTEQPLLSFFFLASALLFLLSFVLEIV